MKLRSLLYVPAHLARFIDKAHQRGADAIILDLEDSVPAASKLSARQGLADSARKTGQLGATIFVRINSEADLQFDDAAAACRAGAYGLVVPKVQTVEGLDRLAAYLAPLAHELGRDPMPFICLIEDPATVFDARALAAHPRVLGMALGSEDFATMMGAEPSPDVLRLPKLLVHMAAKAHGKLSFGLLRSIADYADSGAMQTATIEAKTFGFDGATCIHPSAIPFLNTGFSPTEAECDWARRLIAGADKAATENRGAFAFEGRMVDAPVLSRARAILAKVGRDGEDG
ncbi:HpcH/HpaI aldolase/citrate lyase family protein [Pararhizobium sp. DWP3-4]|uniref:HpcH/HpaI aldolase/citrate lyase family protein n=1 Tax=Pararhizobium sp. DWP3-4 TaxID=2804565 RepID=UPI003CF9692F